jgi:hypothetical protein
VKTPATITSSESLDTEESAPHPIVAPGSPPIAESFVESDTDETKLHYGLGTFAWPVRIIWFGLLCLAVYYIAAFYVPSLKAWMSWTPPR